MDYDGWASGIPVGEYLKLRDVMHERRREEIVRCRDCKHYHGEFKGCDEFGDESRGEYAKVEPGGYCAWAERRASQ